MSEVQTVEIPIKALELLKIQGYIKRFHELRQHHTQMEAWETLEDELFSYFKINRYNSYYSFRTSRKVRKNWKAK